MIRQRDIRGFKARFHRNGISGHSFYVCRFDCHTGPASEWEPMTAIVFDAEGHVAVTADNHPDTKWRGDEFEPAMREAIRLQIKNQPDLAHVA